MNTNPALTPNLNQPTSAARRGRVVAVPLLWWLLLALPAEVQAQFTYQSFTYQRSATGEITIQRYNGPGGDVVMPSEIDGFPVIHMGGETFAFSKVTSVTIPDSIIAIGGFQFCTNLTSVTIGHSVTNIGGEAFIHCTRLSSVTIPGSVTSISDAAFAECSSLSSVTIPNSVTRIGDFAFDGCSSLTSVTIPNSLTTIEDYAFRDCTSLINLTIPDSVTSIRYSAFSGCTRLSSVTIPNSVTTIGNYAFAGCTGLTSITIGNSVTSIGAYAFYYSSGLSTVNFQGNAPIQLGLDVFIGANKVTVYYLPGTTGWKATFGGRPTAPWNPQILTGDGDFGVKAGQFGFNINWASGQTVVVEATTDLAQPVWTPVSTNTLTAGTAYFSDPQWQNYPSRLYRLRTP